MTKQHVSSTRASGRRRAACLLACLGAAALWAASDTCIVSGWPVATSATSASAVSTMPFALGVASDAVRTGEIDFNRRTRDASEGTDLDAREFTPGYYILLR